MAEDADLVGRLILAARLCRSLRAASLKKLGLYAGQDNLLKCLAENDGLSMGALADSLGVRPPTVTKMVNRMTARGLLRRQGSKSDSRRSNIFLTAAGNALLDDIDMQWQRATSAAFSGLTEKDEKRLRKILGKIILALEPEADNPDRKSLD